MLSNWPPACKNMLLLSRLFFFIVLYDFNIVLILCCLRKSGVLLLLVSSSSLLLSSSSFLHRCACFEWSSSWGFMHNNSQKKTKKKKNLGFLGTELAFGFCCWCLYKIKKNFALSKLIGFVAWNMSCFSQHKADISVFLFYYNESLYKKVYLAKTCFRVSCIWIIHEFSRCIYRTSIQ